jgi:hypothetical protein
VWREFFIVVLLSSRVLKQLLLQEPRKWPSLPQHPSLFQNQILTALSKIVSLVTAMLFLLLANSRFLFVGKFSDSYCNCFYYTRVCLYLVIWPLDSLDLLVFDYWVI